jgi:hypothetical protein
VPFVSKPVPRLLAWLPLESVRVALSSLMRFTHFKDPGISCGLVSRSDELDTDVVRRAPELKDKDMGFPSLWLLDRADSV